MKKIYNKINKIVEIINKIPPFILAFVVSLVIFLITFYIMKMKDLDMQNFILATTFFAIFWYSLETRKLKNATRFANAIQAEPMLVLKYRKEKDGDKLYIKNHGKGVAFNIKAEPLTGSFDFSFLSPPNSLGYNEEAVLYLKCPNINNDIDAEIVLSCDNFDEKIKDRRKFRYKIFTANIGYRIEYIK